MQTSRRAQAGASMPASSYHFTILYR